MLPNQVWKSKETKSYILKIIGQNPDGTVRITFDFGYTPKSTHNYTQDYLNQFYEYAGYESVWINDWTHLSPVIEFGPAPITNEVNDFFENMNTEKVLFGDYTKEEKVNTWKDIPKVIS